MQRVSVREAAEILGITREAVRKRISRGTLAAEKVDGEWVIGLPGRESSGQDAGSTALVEQLRGEVEWLRRELDTRTEEIRRRDHIIAGFQRQLPANTETRAGAWERIKRWAKGEG